VQLQYVKAGSTKLREQMIFKHCIRWIHTYYSTLLRGFLLFLSISSGFVL